MSKDNGGPASDKIQQARRELFEAWAERHRMPIGRDGVVVDYSARETDACWQAFNAALDAVVIVLPEYTDEVRQYGYAAADVHSAIESTNLGIKVK